MSALLASGDARAAVRHIHYADELQKYDIAWDPARLKGYDMNDCVWMSPFYRPSGEVRFEFGSTEDGPGRPNKQIGMSLESVPLPIAAREFATHRQTLPRGTPGSPENWRFLDRNLEFGKKQVEELRAMNLPAVLEPVRDYLIYYANRDVRWARARYNHARTGDTQPLREAVCELCGCAAIDFSSLQPAGEPGDVGARLAASNRLTIQLLQCSAGLKFPLEAWQKFVKRYGIRETSVFRGPD